MRLSALRAARGDVRPVGFIEALARASVPVGWLLCDGSVVTQASYPRLFEVIGTIYNTGGEGAGNFRLPNLQGEFLRGHDAGRGIDSGRGIGTAQSAQRQSHSHPKGTLATNSVNIPHSHGPFSTPPATGEHLHNQRLTYNSPATLPLQFDSTAPLVSAPATSEFPVGVNTGAANMPHSHPSGSAPAQGIPHSHSVTGDTDFTGGDPVVTELRPRNLAMNFVIRY